MESSKSFEAEPYLPEPRQFCRNSAGATKVLKKLRAVQFHPTTHHLMDREKAIIDGSNAVHLLAPQVRRPDIRNISAIVSAVEASGRDAIIVIDPGIRSVIADADEFERLMSDPRIMTVPPGQDTSRFVLETAARLDAVIVSNNTYVDYYEDFPWIEARRIPVAAVNGAVLLLDQKMKRAS